MILLCEQDEGEEEGLLEGLRRAASAAAAAEFLQAHGHRLLTPEATAPEVLRELQAAAEVHATCCPVAPWGNTQRVCSVCPGVRQ